MTIEQRLIPYPGFEFPGHVGRQISTVEDINKLIFLDGKRLSNYISFFVVLREREFTPVFANVGSHPNLKPILEEDFPGFDPENSFYGQWHMTEEDKLGVIEFTRYPGSASIRNIVPQARRLLTNVNAELLGRLRTPIMVSDRILDIFDKASSSFELSTYLV